MAKALEEMLTRLAELACIKDLFEFVGADQITASRYESRCREARVEEMLVVDHLAFYDLEAKVIVFCASEFEREVRRFRICSAACCEVFALYVLLHEFTHYIMDVFGLNRWLRKLEESKRFDEPFCEYAALRALATEVYRVFEFERRLRVPPRTQECLPFIASLPRPYPYRLFRELYAAPHEIFGTSAESILLSMLSAIQLLEKPPEAGGSVPANQSSQPNPHTSLSKLREASSDKFYTLLSDTLKSREPESLLRLALLARLSEANALELLVPRTPEAISPVKVTVV
ncbi:MAG: hypothetical protein QW448_04540 [Thermofilaceae archaeon]